MKIFWIHSSWLTHLIIKHHLFTLFHHPSAILSIQTSWITYSTNQFISHQSFFHWPCRLLLQFWIIILHFQWTSPVLHQFSFPPTSSTISKSFHPSIFFPPTMEYSSTTFPASTIMLNYYSFTHQ
jgi:hypothetical protein